MTDYDFTHQAEKMFLKLPKDIQERIIHKIEHYLRTSNPLIFAKRIEDSPLATYRFQIGD